MWSLWLRFNSGLYYFLHIPKESFPIIRWSFGEVRLNVACLMLVVSVTLVIISSIHSDLEINFFFLVSHENMV